MDNIDINYINKININEGYFYWSNKNDLEKLVTLKKKDDNYFLPSIPYDSLDLDDLIGKNVILFFKSPKILYGLFKISNILIKNPKEPNYLEIQDSVNKKINKNILFDEDNFNSLIRLFSIIDIPGLFFINFEKIYIFEHEININNLNNFLSENHQNQNHQTHQQINNLKLFKYPPKIKEKNIIKAYLEPNLKNFLIDWISCLDKNTDLNTNTNTDLNTNTNTDLNTNTKYDESSTDELNSNIKFKIPILWNGCNEFKKNFFDPDIKKNKKFLMNHWVKCAKCEIINNNIKSDNSSIKLHSQLNSSDTIFKPDKKIIIQTINDKNNFLFFDKIINRYQSNLELTIQNNNSNFVFEEDNINLVCCSDQYKNIYSNCIFLIYK